MEALPPDFENARSTLGVTLDADAREVKRAYLRLVRKHSPERDPEGFRRVREAFELLESPFYQQWRKQARPEPPAAPSPRADSTPDGGPSSDPAPSAKSASDHAPTASEDPGLAWYRETHDLLRKQLDGEETSWRERLGACPESGYAWELYFGLLCDHELGPLFLEAAAQAGLPGFETALLQYHPEKVPAPEVDLALANRELPSVVRLNLAIENDRRREAAELAVDLIRDHAETIPAHTILRLLFLLEGERLFTSARSVYDALVERMNVTQSERATFQSMAVDWYLVQSYFAAREHLSDPQKVMLGRTLDSLDWEAASERLRSQEFAASPELARSTARAIEKFAPARHAVLYPAPEGTGPASGRRRWTLANARDWINAHGWLIIGLVFLLQGLIRCATRHPSTPKPALQTSEQGREPTTP